MSFIHSSCGNVGSRISEPARTCPLQIHAFIHLVVISWEQYRHILCVTYVHNLCETALWFTAIVLEQTKHCNLVRVVDGSRSSDNSPR